MRYEVTAEYSEALVRTASRRFVVKFLGWDFLAAWLVTLVGLVLLLTLGAYGWLTGLFGTLLVLTTIFGVAFPIAYYRRGLALLRKMKTPRARWVFDDMGISVQSDLSTGSIHWTMIEKLWCFPEVWLFFVAKGVSSTLPVSCISQDLKAFILQKAQEAGTRVSPPVRGAGRGRA